MNASLLAKRKLRREKKIAAMSLGLRSALRSGNSFTNRAAFDLNVDDKESSRKIHTQPGFEAKHYVAEILGRFDIKGSLRTSYVGMDRSAGSGGHGVTEGTITVDAMLIPLKGMTQTIEVPVQVKNGYMQEPGLFYHGGIPYILAQSSLDDIMQNASFPEPPKGDRITAQLFESKRDYEHAMTDWERRQEEEKELERKRKMKRLTRMSPEPKTEQINAPIKPSTPSAPQLEWMQSHRAMLSTSIDVYENDLVIATLDAGSAIKIVAEFNDGYIHVQHESGQEVIVPRDVVKLSQ